MKQMYLHVMCSQHMNLICFVIPGDGGAREMSGMSGLSLPQRHYCLGEQTSVAFQKSYVWMRSECVWEAEKMQISGSLIPFWSFWKVFLFFITGVFTVQIVFMKIRWTRSYFSSANVHNVQRAEGQSLAGGDNTMESSVSAIFNHSARKQTMDGMPWSLRRRGTSCWLQRGSPVTGVSPSEREETFLELKTLDMVYEGCQWPNSTGEWRVKPYQVFLNGFIFQRWQRFNGEMQKSLKRSIAIRFKSESWCCLGHFLLLFL